MAGPLRLLSTTAVVAMQIAASFGTILNSKRSSIHHIEQAVNRGVQGTAFPRTYESFDGYGPSLPSLHDAAEAIYHESRQLAMAARASKPAASLTGTVTDLGSLQRVWDFFYPTYNCPLLKERLGRIGDGGKWICGMRFLLQRRPCIVYSLGSAGDTTFEQEILGKTSCEVHTFDHTLDKETAEQVAGTQGIVFHAVGVGNPSQKGLQSLEDIMSGLGHDWIDVLKIDIEQHEWELLHDFYSRAGATLPATQLMIEFHFTGNLSIVWEAFDKLLDDDFRVFSVEPNYYCNDGCCARDLLEFAFIKVSPSGALCVPSKDRSKTGRQLPPDCKSSSEAP